LYKIEITNEYFLSRLVDLGARPDYYVFIFQEYLSFNTVDISTEEHKLKLKDMIAGSLQFSGTTFVNDLGRKVYKDVEETYRLKSDEFVCYVYDATLGIGINLDMMLLAGKAFEETTPFRKSWMELRFTDAPAS
jgi:hypothetical protein